MQFAPALSSGAAPFDPIDLREEGFAYAFALALPPGDLSDDLPGHAQLARDPGEEAPVKKWPPKLGPARVTINAAYFGSHMPTVIELPIYNCQAKFSGWRLILPADGPKADEWGPRVKALRDILELSQNGLAVKLGVTPTTVYGWEKGRKQPTEAHFIKMGNLAPIPERYWFWARGGLDLSLIAEGQSPKEETTDNQPLQPKTGRRTG
jgi:DNA-binding XRE family transcriptional regulator